MATTAAVASCRSDLALEAGDGDCEGGRGGGVGSCDDGNGGVGEAEGSVKWRNSSGTPLYLPLGPPG